MFNICFEKGITWYISYEQFNLIANKDIKLKVLSNAPKKAELIDNRFNEDIKINSLMDAEINNILKANKKN